MVPPERVELSSPAPEAGTLSTELQGHSELKNSMSAWGPTRTAGGCGTDATSRRVVDKPQAPH